MQLGVGVAPHLRVRILGWVDELIADVAVAGAELVEQAQGFGLQALKSSRKVAFQVNGYQHRFFDLVDEGLGGVAQAKPLVGSEVQAQEYRAEGGKRHDGYRDCHGGDAAQVFFGFEHQARSGQEGECESAKVEHVVGVDHAAAHRGVVFADAPLEEVESTVGNARKVNERIKSRVQGQASGRAADKSHDGVVGACAEQERDGEVGAAQDEQSEVGTRSAAEVEVAHRVAQNVQRRGVKQGGKQRQPEEPHAGQPLTDDNIPGGQRFCAQPIEGSGTPFFGEHAHRQRGYQKQKHPRRKHKKPVKLGVSAVEQVKVARHEPEKHGVESEVNA